MRSWLCASTVLGLLVAEAIMVLRSTRRSLDAQVRRLSAYTNDEHSSELSTSLRIVDLEVYDATVPSMETIQKSGHDDISGLDRLHAERIDNVNVLLAATVQVLPSNMIVSPKMAQKLTARQIIDAHAKAMKEMNNSVNSKDVSATAGTTTQDRM